MENLQMGVVRLKSGGPAMTVTYVEQRPQLQCHWFVGGEVKSGTFNEAALEKTER